MSNLATHRIDDFASMKYGKMPPKNIVTESGYPIYSGYRITGFAKEYLYKDPELIVVARGVGGTGDVKISPAEAWITNLSIVLKLNSEIVDKRFLFYRLGREPLKERLNTGAAQAQITIENLRSYKIDLPSLPAQKRIASILTAYDDLIENNRRRIELLEEAARLLYREWFVHFRFPGHEHVKIVDGVPEGWELTTLGLVAKTNPQNHKKDKLPEVLNYIDISSVSRGSIDYKTKMNAADAPGRARRVAQHRDTIWSNVRPNLRAYSIVLNPEMNDVFSTGFTVIHAERVSPFYLYFFTTSDAFVDHLINHATGTSYPAVRPEDFEKAELLVPIPDLMESFEEFCEPVFDQIEKLKKASSECAKARDLLLPRLMDGRLEVAA